MASGSVAEIKSRLAVADVVGETVALRKAGTTMKGLCPFHGEKTPSFIVTPGRETWKCFGCGKGGDIFTFVMERDALSFGEALTLLAAKAGVVIDDRSRAEDARKARLREVLEGAVSFYHAILTGHELGRPALDYLHSRGFTDATIEAQRLGWAPDSWDACSKALAAKRGATAAELEAVGLTTDRGGGRGAYDRFRARVIFPIRDANGKVTGLGGRVLPGGDDADHGPKYLNTAATSLFDKSRTLYLIDKAKAAIRKSGTAVLVEGYTDALMAHQSGFENVVASMGTALTPAQVALLLRYGSKILLAYDVDAAGAKAGAFGATELLRLVADLGRSEGGPSLVDVGIVQLPDGKDPDEVVRDQPDAWRAAVERPVPVVEYLIETHAAAHDLKDLGGRKRAVDAIKPVMRILRDPVVRDGYLSAAARRIGVDESTIREAMRQPGGDLPRETTAETKISADRVRAADVDGDVAPILAGVTPPEAELLRLLLVAPGERLRVRDTLSDDLLASGLARSLWRGLRDAMDTAIAAGTSPNSLERLPASIDGEERRLAQALLTRESGQVIDDRARKGIDQTLLRLEADRLDEAMAWSRSEIADAERASERERVRDLMERERDLTSRRKALDRRLGDAGVLAIVKGGGA